MIQLYESFFKKNDWPFSSFAMYSETLAYKNNYVIVVAYFKQGEPQILQPWELFPIDYYKTRIIMNNIFLKDEPNFLKEKKDIIAQMFGEMVQRKDLVKLEFLKIAATASNLKTITKFPTKAELLYAYEIRK